MRNRYARYSAGFGAITMLVVAFMTFLEFAVGLTGILYVIAVVAPMIPFGMIVFCIYGYFYHNWKGSAV
jgi:hypothetical protein